MNILFKSNINGQSTLSKNQSTLYEIISEFLHIIFICSWRTLLNPTFDGRYFLDFLLKLFQILIFLNDVAFHQKICVIQKTDESEIGPRQSTADEVTTILLYLCVQTLQIIRYRLISNFAFIFFSLFKVSVNI